MAARTTVSLAMALLILFLLTKATHQPLTVALLGVLITMVAGRAVNEPDPHKQKITLALLPLPAALSLTAATVLAPHRVLCDVVFVVVVYASVYARRYGPRGRALGMVAFMAYFFAQFLRATTRELPWLIGAVLIGTVCSFVMTVVILPDRPEGVLRATMRSLRARMAIVIDTTAEALEAGRLDERRRRRLRARTARLNETALMVQSQIEEKVNPAVLWPDVSGEDLALWLFDAELTVERVATAGGRAAIASADIPVSTRADLAGALSQLARAIRLPQPEGLQRAAQLAQELLDHPSTPAANPTVRRLALAIIATASAASEVRTMVERAAAETSMAPSFEDNGSDEEQAHGAGLLPTTKQAIQVAVAASLAIVIGEVVSPSRWYWAVIAAFVIFAGTNTWNETVTKGWARLIGTALGVPAGMLVATVVSGNRTASLVLIFVCVFCSLYFLKVAYSAMTFWITTMLALLYGLLGQFSYRLLLLRIEETAIGAVIGATVAIVVLPTNARTSMRNDARAFLTTLANVIDVSVATLFGREAAVSPTDKARQLDRDLQQFRTTAKPLAAGVGGFSGRHSVRHAQRMLAACDRYGRTLARNSEPFEEASPRLADAITSAASHIRRSIDVLTAALHGNHDATVMPATDFLDAAEAFAREHRDGDERSSRARLLAIVHSLRQIDRAVVSAAVDLGAEDVVAEAAKAGRAG
ncbi:FUSC family protein [Mycobacterium sp.]|uniref:FUSC family protein n=1 Tax=Mycobacterium sp. TaxID=1785 RepID=UPI003C706802